MPIPWQSPDSSVQGILQEQPPSAPPELPAGWTALWGIDGNWWIVNWLEGQNLQNFLQQWVAAVAHLDGSLVRPRWQRTPPNIPDFDVTWAAVGMQRARPLGTYAWVGHNGRNGIPVRTIWDMDASKWDVRPRPDGNIPVPQSEWDAELGAMTDGYGEFQRHEELENLVTFYGPEAEEHCTRMHNNVSVWQNIALLRLVGLAFVEAGETVWAPELVKEQWLNRVDKRLTFRRIVRRNYPILNIVEACGQIHVDPGGYVKQFCAPPRPAKPRGYWDLGLSLWDLELGRSLWNGIEQRIAQWRHR